MLPPPTRQCSLTPKNGLNGLKVRGKMPVPSLFPTECLVQVAAVSPNYRDVAIPAGKYPGYCKDRLVTYSDAAGTVLAVGDRVTLHEVGDCVCTLFNQAHQSGVYQGDGKEGLVTVPDSFTLTEAATIPCAAVTAWNALVGLARRAVKEGGWILTQGAGGVKLFAIAFAQAVSANTIGTRSSDEKTQILREMGVEHVINYRTHSHWGATAKQRIGSDGVHLVVNVGGESTIRQSLSAVRPEGVVALIGFLGGAAESRDTAGFAECFDALTIMWSVEQGPREQFVEMNRFIDENWIKPVVDQRTFGFEEVREAYDFLFASSWGNASSTVTPKPTTRSVTPGPTPTKSRSAFPLPNRLVKALSSPSIKDKAEKQREEQENRIDGVANGYTEATTGEDKSGMAAAVARPIQRTSLMMDTRTPSPPVRKPEEGSEDGTPEIEITPSKPEGLNAEIQMLSTKLVNAINYNTNLDDTLQATRSELEQARSELARVRAEKRSLDDAITQGVLVKKSEVDKTMSSLRAEMAQARAEREKAEKAKKQTEGELENLTSALFEEANSMVAAARKDTEAVEKRNSQLRSQLQDTEVLLISQQEQLQDLKSTMEKLEQSDHLRDSSMPSTPVTGPGTSFDSMVPHSPAGAGVQAIQPAHPLHFTSMLAPILRNDVSAYQDFSELLVSARKAQPHSRNVSGNYSSTNLSSGNVGGAAAGMTSSPNLPGAFSFGGSTSANSSPSSSGFNGVYPYVNPPLKESKFWKRILVEDIEPTLRLDLAPGLSFLSRRTVNSSLLNGTLVVEPFQQQSYKFYAPVFACALCGESRKSEPYIRRYRFRTSEADDAQRYPLCEYCLGRVRTSCDFVGFLRNVRDGHWRCENESEEKGAWEEAVKLRERMFWARLGGGVVPRGQLPAANVAQRPSLDSVPEKRESAAINQTEAKAVEAAPQLQEAADEQASEAEPEGIGRALVNMSARAASSAVPEIKPQTPDQPADVDPVASQDEQNEASAQLQREAGDAAPSIDKPTPDDPPPTVLQAPSASAVPITPPAEATPERFATPTGSRSSSPFKTSSRPHSPAKTQSRPSSPQKTSVELRRLSSPIVSRPTSPVKSAFEDKRLSSPSASRPASGSTSPFKRPTSPTKPESPVRASSALVGEERSPSRVAQLSERSRSRSRLGRSELRPESPALDGASERRGSSQGGAAGAGGGAGGGGGSSVLARVRAMEAGKK